MNRLNRETNQFEFYLNDPDDPQSISSNIVRLLMEDENGVLWVGTHGGLNRFDENTNTFQRFVHNPEDPTSLSDDRISVILVTIEVTYGFAPRAEGSIFLITPHKPLSNTKMTLKIPIV